MRADQRPGGRGRSACIAALLLAAGPAIAAGQAQTPATPPAVVPAPVAPPVPAVPPAPPLPRCAEDAEGGACVWGRVEGFEAGAVQIRGLRVALAGVTVPGRHELCASRSTHEEFDCARPARRRMADLLKGGIACEIVDAAASLLWGRCRVAEGDLGRLLIQAGTARAAKDGPYEDSQIQAVTAKRGLWSADMVLPRDWESAKRKTEDKTDN